jgi:hypothetical protein
MRKLSTALAFVVCGCASYSPTAAPTRLVLTPPATMSTAEAEAVMGRCGEETAGVHAPRQQVPVNYGAGSAGIIGSMIGAGLVQGFSDGRARRQALNTCLAREGYVPVILTEDQWRAYRSLEGAERSAYIAQRLETQMADPQMRAKLGLAPQPLPESDAEATLASPAREGSGAVLSVPLASQSD